VLPCGVVRSALAELGERGPDPNQLGGMLRSPSLELSKEVSAFLWDVETEREVVGAIQPANRPHFLTRGEDDLRIRSWV